MNVQIPSPWFGLTVSVSTILVAGGIAWGQSVSKNEEQDRRINDLTKKQEVIQDVRTEQAVTNVRLQEMSKQQANIQKLLEELVRQSRKTGGNDGR